MVDTASKTGYIAQIIGPVVDIQFPSGDLPKVYNAVVIGTGDSAITCEGQIMPSGIIDKLAISYSVPVWVFIILVFDAFVFNSFIWSVPFVLCFVLSWSAFNIG